MLSVLNFWQQCFKQCLALVCCLLAGAVCAQARPVLDHLGQPWPSKPITLVVPVPAGGGADASARILAERMSEALKTRVVVENRAGAESLVGIQHVMASAPDGYTLLFAFPSLIHVRMTHKIEVDPLKALSPVAKITESSLILLVRPPLANTWAELLQKGKLSRTDFNCAGSGANPSLSCQLLRTMGQFPLQLITYKGNAPAMQDLLGGHVDMMFDVPGGAQAHVAAGGVRALASTGSRRAEPPFADLPLTKDLVPGFVLDTWQGVMLPTGTPEPIRKQLEWAIQETLNDPAVRQKLNKIGLSVQFENATQFAQTLSSDVKKYQKLFEVVGVVKK
jgi:hypothetical protein